MTSARFMTLLLFAAMLLGWQQVHAAVYTDEDLERYSTKQGKDPKVDDSGSNEAVEDRPSRTAKSSNDIFRENERSIAAVAAYDERGISFSHGSGFVISARGKKEAN